MLLALSLTLLMSAPDPFAAMPTAAQAMFRDYLETRAKEKRVLEVVATGVAAGESRAVLLDRTGCLRGWVVLSSVTPAEPGLAPSFEARERLGEDCLKPRPISHFARLQHALATADRANVSSYFAPGLHFPVLRTDTGKPSRKTWTGEDVMRSLGRKYRPALPLCDLLQDEVVCSTSAPDEKTGPSGFECACKSRSRTLTYEFRPADPTLGEASPVQVISVRLVTN